MLGRGEGDYIIDGIAFRQLWLNVDDNKSGLNEEAKIATMTPLQPNGWITNPGGIKQCKFIKQFTQSHASGKPSKASFELRK